MDREVLTENVKQAIYKAIYRELRGPVPPSIDSKFERAANKVIDIVLAAVEKDEKTC